MERGARDFRGRVVRELVEAPLRTYPEADSAVRAAGSSLSLNQVVLGAPVEIHTGKQRSGPIRRRQGVALAVVHGAVESGGSIVGECDLFSGSVSRRYFLSGVDSSWWIKDDLIKDEVLLSGEFSWVLEVVP